MRGVVRHILSDNMEMDNNDLLKREFETATYEPVNSDLRYERNLEDDDEDETRFEGDHVSDDDSREKKRNIKKKKLSADYTNHTHQEQLAVRMLKRLPKKSRNESVVETLLPGYDVDQVLSMITKL